MQRQDLEDGQYCPVVLVLEIFKLRGMKIFLSQFKIYILLNNAGKYGYGIFFNADIFVKKKKKIMDTQFCNYFSSCLQKV